MKIETDVLKRVLKLAYWVRGSKGRAQAYMRLENTTNHTVMEMAEISGSAEVVGIRAETTRLSDPFSAVGEVYTVPLDVLDRAVRAGSAIRVSDGHVVVEGQSISYVPSPVRVITNKYTTGVAWEISDTVTGVISGIRATVHGVSTDPTRPGINQLLVEYSRDRQTVVSTDGHRMAYASSGDPSHGYVHLVHGPFAGWLAKYAPANSSLQFTRLYDGKTVYNTRCNMHGLSVIASYRTSEDFPPWRLVVPKHRTACTVDVGQIIKPLMVASKTLGYDSAVVLQSVGYIGEVRNLFGETICVLGPTDFDFKVAVNLKYLRESLKNSVATTFDLRVGGPLGPIHLVYDNGVGCVIMPRRLS